MAPKKLFLMLGGLAAVVFVIVGVLIYSVLGATQPVADTGNSFMTALRDADYPRAYALGSPGFQQRVGDAAGLQRVIATGKVQRTDWSFSSRSVSGDTAELKGRATYTGGQKGPVLLTLAKVGADWRVTGFDMDED